MTPKESVPLVDAPPELSETPDSPTTGRQKLWFALKAIEIRLRFIAVLVVVGLVIANWDAIKNRWDKWTRPGAEAVTELVGGEEFYCPMHPSVVRTTLDPGGAIPKCPICGMPLSKRKKGSTAPLAEGVLSRVQLSPYRVQVAGIETAEVAHRPLTMNVRALGVVAVDERKLSRIVVRASGYVEKLFVNESFAEVQKGQPLAEIYSPEIYTAARELVLGRSGQVPQYVESSKRKLELLGLAPEEIDEIIRTDAAKAAIVIRSPDTGHVFEKRIVQGDRVEPGQTLFEVADLSTVWIEGELYEQDAVALQVGQMVEATVDAYPGRVFTGRLIRIHPHVETATRTLRARCEMENPNHELRPGMFATLKFSTPMIDVEPFRSELAKELELAELASAAIPESPEHDAAIIERQAICPVTGLKLGSMGTPMRETHHDRVVFLCCPGCPDKFHARPDYYISRLSPVTPSGVLAVPESAVIDTGEQQVVYVEREPGVFEGVSVTLGPRADGYYAVIGGVLAGDRVANAGAFLIDAETRLNPSASAAYFGASGSQSKSAPTDSPPAPPAPAN